MEKNVPTVLKTKLCNALLLGQANTFPAYTTINQKLNIQSGVNPDVGQNQTMKYVMIGNGGLSIQTGADNFTYTKSYVHSPTDTGLFQEIPFLVRPVNGDISGSQQAQYRLRRYVTVAGVGYFAYYGKVIDLSSVSNDMENRQVNPDGSQAAPTPWVPSASDLSPTPTILATGDAVTTSGKYIAGSAKLPFPMSAQDILELLNASQLLYGDQNHATISEIAICAGVDKNVSTTVGGTASVTYTEVIACQVMSFLATNFPSSDSSQGGTWTFDVGFSEPKLAPITP